MVGEHNKVNLETQNYREDVVSMKRVFVVLLSMVMSVFFLAQTALAKEDDLASMSLDDLLALRQNVEREIIARLASDASMLYTGVYYVGNDIKEGQYVITCTESFYQLLVTVFASEDEYATYLSSDTFTLGEESAAREANSKMSEYIAVGKSVYVNLEAGMVLKIEYGVGQAQLVEMNWAL